MFLQTIFDSQARTYYMSFEQHGAPISPGARERMFADRLDLFAAFETNGNDDGEPRYSYTISLLNN